jgi:hypothetical protein
MARHEMNRILRISQIVTIHRSTQATCRRRESDIRRFHFLTPVLLGLCLGGLAACAPHATSTGAKGQIPPIAPQATRVWFFRGWDSLSGQGNVYAAAPTIFANGQPIGDIPTGTEFFHDFAPETYTFTVEPYGLPTAQAVTLQLAAGKQSYLQVQWVASWEFGYPEADFSFAPNTFAVLSVQPQLAQAYLATLTNLGQR